MTPANRVALRFAPLVFLLLFSGNAKAHRLDEYLQASRIQVAANRVDVEMDLTPGAEVADSVLASVDADRDGSVSLTEALAYAQEVVSSVSLDVDGVAQRLQLTGHRFPSASEMRRGEGVIRLRATAALRSAEAGRHKLAFSNRHRTDISVFLVNALIPADSEIRITGQERDTLQTEFQMDYNLRPKQQESPLAAALPPLTALAIAAGLLLVTRRLRDSETQTRA